MYTFGYNYVTSNQSIVMKLSTIIVEIILSLCSKNHKFICLISPRNWSRITSNNSGNGTLCCKFVKFDMYPFGDYYETSTWSIVMKFLPVMVDIIISL
jgi:hypothetical protein